MACEAQVRSEVDGDTAVEGGRVGAALYRMCRYSLGGVNASDCRVQHLTIQSDPCHHSSFTNSGGMCRPEREMQEALTRSGNNVDLLRRLVEVHGVNAHVSHMRLQINGFQVRGGQSPLAMACLLGLREAAEYLLSVPHDDGQDPPAMPRADQLVQTSQQPCGIDMPLSHHEHFLGAVTRAPEEMHRP